MLSVAATPNYPYTSTSEFAICSHINWERERKGVEPCELGIYVCSWYKSVHNISSLRGIKKCTKLLNLPFNHCSVILNDHEVCHDKAVRKEALSLSLVRLHSCYFHAQDSTNVILFLFIHLKPFFSSFTPQEHRNGGISLDQRAIEGLNIAYFTHTVRNLK